MYLKSCPKCKGDLYLSQDFYGKFFNCLQCGFIFDMAWLKNKEKENPSPDKNTRSNV